MRLGDARTRWLYVALVCVPFIVSALMAVAFPPTLLGLVALPLAIGGIRTVTGGATGRQLIPVLGSTGRAMLIWALLTAATLFWGGLGQ